MFFWIKRYIKNRLFESFVESLILDDEKVAVIFLGTKISVLKKKFRNCIQK